MISNRLKIGLIQVSIMTLFIAIVGVISYNKYNATLQETTKNLNEKIISFHFETFHKLSKLFLEETENHFVQKVEKESSLRKRFESMMDLIRISTVQNLFVVARNRNGEYYFLLDSEQKPSEHANIFEPFDPLGNAWDKCYKSAKEQIFYHKHNRNLWITIIYPIVENGKTVALIGADISHQLDINMQQRLKDFTHFFFWLIFFSLFFFVLLYMLTLHFRRKYYDAYIDPLTHTYNRKYLYDVVINKLSRHYQLFMIDIDFFKKVNDNYGHDAGDAVLQEVARRIKSLIRDEDSFIRYGGEEFLIYTTTLNKKKCLEFAERIRKSVKEEPIIYKNVEYSVTVSIGVNPNATKKEPFADMQIKADKALYDAKLSGRDCVKFSK